MNGILNAARAAFGTSLDSFIPASAAPVDAANSLSSSICFEIQFMGLGTRVLHHKNIIHRRGPQKGNKS